MQGSMSIAENLCKLRVSSALKTGFYDDALNLGKVPECNSSMSFTGRRHARF